MQTRLHLGYAAIILFILLLVSFFCPPVFISICLRGYLSPRRGILHNTNCCFLGAFCFCAPQVAIFLVCNMHTCLCACVLVSLYRHTCTHTRVLCNLSILIWDSVPLTVWGFFLLYFLGRDTAYSSAMTEAEFRLEERRLSVRTYRKCVTYSHLEIR